MVLCPRCGEENPDRFRLCGFCGAELAPALPAQEVRKTVTIVFSDLKGSTAMGEKLDSEAVREVMSRYFDEMRGALERHGGTIEKYIGDAIMAVFGLPRLHEDDALRAVRAAADMRDRLAALNVELEAHWGVTIGNRTGINTGEVVAGDPASGQRLVTGDTVNTAARLEQAAPTNEILLGDATYRLVRHAVEVEPVEPLELKGKAERVPAFRLVAIRDAETVERRYDRPLVGRTRELELLDDALSVARRDRVCRLVTVVGEAGAGKSRLLEEVARRLGGDGRLVRGRCLPYGRGITFWPLLEIAREAAGIGDEHTPEQARAKLLELTGPDGADAVARVASAIGLADGDSPLDEVFWGARRFFELVAAREPLVIAFEDIHWAEGALLDLIEHLVATSAGAPLVVLCAARPDLFEVRPGWREHGTTIELERLTDEESALVAENLLGSAELPEAARQRIVAAAEGNPLFVEQLLAMLIDDGALREEDGHWVATGELLELALPGTIQALLTARLDLLSPQQRAVIEPASVIGLVFEREAVSELVAEAVRPGLDEHLAELTRKQLVRPQPGDSSVFRFHHILVRDAAYQGILKRTRASLHERFADWAERVNRERSRETEFEEILGYHLEQARMCLADLGPLDEHGRAVGRRAAMFLAAAGRRAFGRGDMAAAANLLRRAAALHPEQSRERIELLPDLAEAMQDAGEFAWAQLYADEARTGAAALGDPVLEADAILTGLLVQHHVTTDLDAWRAEVERETSRIIPMLDEETSPIVLAKAWRMVSYVHGTVCRWEETALANQRAMHHARVAGDRSREARAASGYAHALGWGPSSVPDAIGRLEEILANGLSNGRAEAIVLLMLGQLHAMATRFDEGRELCERARRLIEDRGGGVLAHALSIAGPARVELLAGRTDAAEELLRRDFDDLTALEENYYRPLVAAVWAQALFDLGRHDEAEAATRTADELGTPDDVETQAVWRSVRAKVLARRGEGGEALALAEQAVALLRETDAPVMQADALLDLADVLAVAGRTEEAVAAAVEARLRYGLKGDLVGAARAEACLDELGHPEAWAAEAEASAARLHT
ncbi:MAG TPA: adenylate/guanylate cyclase domain-containing protein [Gaiellaceae bacterium]|nr:adenylate/guanylate cyclase domain-containing protein [Gaiellaceae bacterium]